MVWIVDEPPKFSTGPFKALLIFTLHGPNEEDLVPVLFGVGLYEHSHNKFRRSLF